MFFSDVSINKHTRWDLVIRSPATQVTGSFIFDQFVSAQRGFSIMVAMTAANITKIGRPNMDNIAVAGISISFMIILFVMGFDRKTEERSALLHVFL